MCEDLQLSAQETRGRDRADDSIKRTIDPQGIMSPRVLLAGK